VKYNLLVLGASYGSLFSTKVLMAGHRVSLVCTRPTAELINREGTLVRFPIRGRESLLDVASKPLPGALSAATPDGVDPASSTWSCSVCRRPSTAKLDFFSDP
jgi:hypothetical protein